MIRYLNYELQIHGLEIKTQKELDEFQSELIKLLVEKYGVFKFDLELQEKAGNLEDATSRTI